MTTALSGMKAIREFCRSINLSSSEASVINMIKTCKFPARKLGGIWESDKELIVTWRKKYILGEFDIEQVAVLEDDKSAKIKRLKNI